MPLYYDSDDNSTESAASLSIAQAKPLVLMLEDHQDARPDLKQALRLKGYQVIDADNGLDAARQARETNPDLLVVDLDVPLLYELVAARQIVKNALVDPLPIVIVTHERAVDPAPFIEIGANRNEYVTRLSDYAELQPLLDYLLPVLPRSDDAGPVLEGETIAPPVPLILFD